MTIATSLLSQTPVKDKHLNDDHLKMSDCHQDQNYLEHTFIHNYSKLKRLARKKTKH